MQQKLKVFSPSQLTHTLGTEYCPSSLKNEQEAQSLYCSLGRQTRRLALLINNLRATQKILATCNKVRQQCPRQRNL